MLKRRLSFAVLLVVGLLFIATVPAGAQTGAQCDQTIFDGANVFGSDVAKVNTAAQQLIATGGDVRVVTVKSMNGAATIDAYEKAVEANCPSWRGPSGLRKNNLVVFMISVGDHKTDIVYGDNWKKPLDPVYIRIQTDDMNTRFKAGDFAGGFVNGINEVNRVIDTFEHPPAVGSAATVVNKKATDLTGLWIVLGSIVALLALGALVVFIVFGIRGRRKRFEEVHEQQRRAQAAKAACAKIIGAFTADNRMDLLQIKVKQLDTPDNKLQSEFDLVSQLANSAAADFSGMSTSKNDPDQKGLMAGEYKLIADGFVSLQHDLEGTQSKLIALEAKVQKTMDDIASIPGLKDKVTATISEAVQVDTAAKAAGFKSIAGGVIQSANDLMGQAIAAGSTAKAVDLFDTALDKAKEALEAAHEPEVQQSALEGQAKSLKETMERLTEELPEVKTEFERIEATYAPETWQSLTGNGSEAARRIDTAKTNVPEIERLIGMDVQNWAAASALAEKTDHLLVEANDLIVSILDLGKHLDRAKGQAAQEIADAESDIAKAEQYLKVHSDDIGRSFLGQIESAKSILEDARAELAKDKPNFIAVVDTALKANHMADDILVKEQDAEAIAERERRQAASALSAAEASVSQADNFISVHRGDVGASAQSNLSRARESLGSMRAARTPSEINRMAAEVRRLADAAYQQASEDHNDAEERRRPAYISTYQPSSSYESSHHEDSYSGGSTSWGSFDSGGGGGSTDWGGGGGGGGGGGTSW